MKSATGRRGIGDDGQCGMGVDGRCGIGDDGDSLPSSAGAELAAPRTPATADACPGVLRLHEAADGFLARIRLPGGRIDAPGLRAVAQAAALGNGIVELTSRAGLQVRGLPSGGGEGVARLLGAGGLLPSPAHDRVRNIAAPPLGGRAPGAVAETDGIVEEIDRALCAAGDLTTLPGRFLFAVDDGTRALDPLGADIELAAERDGLRLCLAGIATRLVVAPAGGAAAAMAAARAFVQLAATEAPGAWRVKDLPGGGRQLALELGLELQDAGESRPRPGGPAAADLRAVAGVRAVGVVRQRDGRAAVAALPPLARLDPRQLDALSDLLAPTAALRASQWRTLTFVDVPAAQASGLAGALQALGLVVSGGSGWEGLSACAGLGACARARIDVRTAAALRAPGRDDASPREHWSGCERCCGEPPGAGVTVVATPEGLLVTLGADDPHPVASAAAAAELLGTARVPA